MFSLVFVLTFACAICKPHRTVAKSRSNKPLQAASFTGTICASCEESETCGTTSTAIQSATITVDGTETETTIDSDGTFTLDLPSGDHIIEVTVTCPYQNGTESTETVTDSQTVTIPSAPAERVTAVFSLQCNSLCDPPAVPVVVQVCVGCDEAAGCDENGTALVEGRMMALVPVENGTDVPSATIDAEGNATFDAVTPGDYYVHIYDEPYGSSTIEVAGQITVEEGDPEATEQETQYFGPLLVENASLCYDPTFLAGRVCADCEAEPPTVFPPNETSTGCTNPLANATVRLTVVSEDGEEVTVETTTDAMGNYQLEPANVTGNYTLEVLSADCTGAEEDIFVSLTGEINATSPTPRTEVNISAFCTLQCTANISGIIYAAENDTANYTEGITDPLPGITIDLYDNEDPAQPLASVVSAPDGTFQFLNVPFGQYTVTAREVPSVGGPTGEGCGLRYDDISLGVDVEQNLTYNVSLVREQECNNASLCGQILFASSYCTNSSDNSSLPIAVSINTTSCTCSNSSFIPFPPPPPCPGRPHPPPPPPPPPYYGNATIDSLWRAFLLGTNYPTLAPSSEAEQEESEESAAKLANNKRVLKNQRIMPPRCPPLCPRPPFPPMPVPPMPNNTNSCNCSVNGTFQGCFEVVAPLPTAVARLYRNGTTVGEDGTNTTDLFQIVAETQVLPNGSFCFINLPEGENYILEIIVSENDTLDLTASNISDALGAITSTVVSQDGAFPPTQQVISFGPITLTGLESSAIPPFTAVFTNENLAAEAVVRLTNGTFESISDNTTNSTLPDNSTAEVLPTQIRYVDPFGVPYMYPLSAQTPTGKQGSAQIVTPSAKKAPKKPKTTVLRHPPEEETSSIKVLRPQKSNIKSSSPNKPSKVPRTTTSSSSVKTKSSHQIRDTKSTKTVSRKNSSSSTVIKHN